MVTKIFLTGVTGYIGGEITYTLAKAHPDYDLTFLVRSEEKAKPVREAYPTAKFVFGDNDSSELIENAAAEADIVIHTALSSDDLPSAKAIAKGLVRGHTAEKPGYWLNISGTGILTWYDMDNKRYGQGPLPDQTYDDIKDIDRLQSLPDSAIHRILEKQIYQATADSDHRIKLAFISPPCIYGVGRGPGNTRSMMLPAMAEWILTKGFAPRVGTGETVWDAVHVRGVSRFLVMLVDAAVGGTYAGVSGGGGGGDENVFGGKAYYFLENGPPVTKWGEVAQWVADEAVEQGFMKVSQVETVEPEQVVDEIGLFWGLNSSSRASRARKYFGWENEEESLRESIPEMLRAEAKRLDIKPTI